MSGVCKIEKGASLPLIAKEIDQERIVKWAQLSGDYNRLHVDPEYAKTTRFGGTIAHGPLSLAFLIELMMACFGASWVMGGRLLDVRFVTPIRPGDRIVIGGTVQEIREEGEKTVVECDLFIDKENGERAVKGRSMVRLSREGK